MKIFNSAIHEIVEFNPIIPSTVSIYVCGPTVQSSPHIGHMRVAVAFDVIRRYLRASGYNVKFVQNVTDIDDKILAKSEIEGVHWREHAQKYEAEFFDGYRALGVELPDEIPHATDYISEQIELIQTLVNRGYAYAGSDFGGAQGDVFFDTTAWTNYGELTNQGCLDELEVSEEDERVGKKSPRDFALWKAPKPSDPQDASWDSPWGRGRPGWHIECSAMSGKLLGDSFDIHGGGLDLRFPHHENETAQSHAAGRGFAKYWMHSAWVTAKGEKMSKSLGNGLSVAEVLGDPLDAFALRYALATVHYRSMLEWTPDTLQSAKTTLKRIHKYLTAAAQNSSLLKRGGASADPSPKTPLLEGWRDSDGVFTSTPLPPAFTAAMDDDFNVSKAIAVVHELIKESPDNAPAVIACLDVLGLNPRGPHWKAAFKSSKSEATKSQTTQIDPETTAWLTDQIKLRTNAKKARDFETADKIRNAIEARGFSLVDTSEGTIWHETH